MLYIASVRLGSKYSGSCEVSPTVGKGRTEEEAIQSCLRQVRSRVTIDLQPAPGVQLPPAIAAKMPANLPDGYGLLILERCDHGDGHPYEWRFFAIKYGDHALHRLSRGACGDMTSRGREWKYTAGESPVMYSFLDSNSDYEYRLPSEGMEFVDGNWETCHSAEYNY